MRDLCDLYLNLFCNIIPPVFDTLDVSPLLAFGVLGFLESINGRRRCIACMLRDLGVQTMKLLTNNPSKYIGVKGYGLSIIGRVPLITPITSENRWYIEAKQRKMGHIYGTDSNRSFLKRDGNGSL